MTDKYAAEAQFWADEREEYLKWYLGLIPELYYHRAPPMAERVTCYPTGHDNALYTWCRFDRIRYLRHLMIDEFAFQGKRILDVGAGPLGLARVFAGAEVWAVDPLVERYREMGYPVDRQGIRYIGEAAEEMDSVPTSSMDAVISVNALDHVDDFYRSARQMLRVLKPSGVLRFEVHYHPPTETEPLSLDDDAVREAFAGVELHKLSDVPSILFYPGLHPSGERLVLWSNSDTMEFFPPWPST